MRAEYPSHRVGGVIDISGGDAAERGQPGGPIEACNADARRHRPVLRII
jgi:hypothetical protein